MTVSLITFIVGLKAGKNQQDRNMKQELYKELYLKLMKIKESIEYNKPYTYSIYEFVHLPNSKVRVNSPINKLQYDGDSIYLSNKLMKDALTLEKDFFRWSHCLNHEITKQLYHSLPQSNDFINGTINRKKHHESDTENHFECFINKMPRRKVVKISLLDIIFDKEAVIKKYDKAFSDNNIFIEFEHILDSRIQYSYSIQSESIIDKKEFIDNVFIKVNQNIKNIDTLNIEKKYYLKEYASIINKVKRKAVDPEGFWETLLKSFIDVFKG